MKTIVTVVTATALLALGACQTNMEPRDRSTTSRGSMGPDTSSMPMGSPPPSGGGGIAVPN